MAFTREQATIVQQELRDLLDKHNVTLWGDNAGRLFIEREDETTEQWCINLETDRVIEWA